MDSQHDQGQYKDSGGRSGKTVGFPGDAEVDSDGFGEPVPQQQTYWNGQQGQKAGQNQQLFILCDHRLFSFQIRDPEHDLLQNGGVQFVEDVFALPGVLDEVGFL